MTSPDHDTAGVGRFRRVRRLAIASGLGALFGAPIAFCVFALAGQPHEFWPTVQAGAIAGAFVGAGISLWRSWNGALGAITAIVAVGVASAVIFGLIAFAAPNCPGGMAGVGRCSRSEVAGWTFAGLLTPVAVALLIGPFVLATRWVVRTVRALVGRVRTRSGRRASTSRGAESTGERGAANRPATGRKGRPKGPGAKGRPTPKRPGKSARRR